MENKAQNNTNKTSTPKHVAIIMDGNGRWAKLHHKTRSAGHHAGSKAVQKTIKAAVDANIEVLSLFAFSTENWHRPKSEVDNLMRLFLKGLQESTKKLHQNKIRIIFIGDLSQFSVKLREQMKKTAELTQHNTGLKLVIAVNYGGQWDILQATKKLINEKTSVEKLSVEDFTAAVTTKDLPDPDLLIRTSGEQRISNFFLWQLAYTELYFTDVLWPDFDEKQFNCALEDYARRKRRFGEIKC